VKVIVISLKDENARYNQQYDNNFPHSKIEKILKPKELIKIAFQSIAKI
jgi:predicted nucleotidyltransferase